MGCGGLPPLFLHSKKDHDRNRDSPPRKAGVKPRTARTAWWPAIVRKYPGTMLEGRELDTFRKQLLGWFRQFQRDLPWRRSKDPYCICLSQIMLQQTHVPAAIPSSK